MFAGKEKIDMQRMQNILERCILEYFSNLESNPHESIAFATIADSLYGEKDEDVSQVLVRFSSLSVFLCCIFFFVSSFSHSLI